MTTKKRPLTKTAQEPETLLTHCPKCHKADFKQLKKKERRDMTKYYLVCRKCGRDFIHIVTRHIED